MNEQIQSEKRIQYISHVFYILYFGSENKLGGTCNPLLCLAIGYIRIFVGEGEQKMSVGPLYA